MPGLPLLDLVAAVRHLANDVAPHDPDEATRRFDVLVAQHGRAACAAPLSWAAPEVGDLAPRLT